MHVKVTKNSETEIVVNITAGEAELEPIKQEIVKKLAKKVKVAGFREGNVPPAIAEKHLDQTTLQTEFLDEAMTRFYARATEQENIRPVTQPVVDIKKFVPFTTLEYDVKTSVIGEIKLGDYKGLKTDVKTKKILEKDLETVLKNLQSRMAEKTAVTRPAKSGDETIIDFKGEDLSGKPINGGDGQDYPLVLGSNAFIPGFEDNLLGVKSGDNKTFEINFPKDYPVKALASKKVKFSVDVKTVNELKEPALNDDFATKVGPFKTLGELKEDIKKQLTAEAEQEGLRAKQNDLVAQLVESSSVALPSELIEQQANFELEDLRRNLNYRGQTYEEFLASEDTTDEKYRKDVLLLRAENQVKTAILLTEIAERENIAVTPEELEVQLQILKGQYTDPGMQAELDKDSARSDIASRILSQKVVNFIFEKSS